MYLTQALCAAPPSQAAAGAVSLTAQAVPSSARPPAQPFQDFLHSAVLSSVHSRPNQRSCSFQPLGGVAAGSLYRASLTQAAAVISRSTEDATVSRRLALGQELTQFLEALPADYPHSLLTARPEELLVFMQGSFIHKHGGTQLPGQPELVASPQGVSCALSHLSTLFESLGRRGPYDPSSGTGNPCDSSEIKRYKQGYSRDLWRAGYQETSAVPLDFQKLEAVLLDLRGQLSRSTSAFEVLSLERDALLMVYSWHSAMRGKEGGSLCLADLHRADRTQLFSLCYVPGTAAPPELLILPTHGTKTNKRTRTHQDPITISLQPPGSPFCFITRLWAYLAFAHQHGHPVTHYLFRPHEPSRDRFKEAPYSSSSLCKMFQARLVALGLFNGETAHSFRRGTLQATATSIGGPLGQIAAALQGRIKTPKILERYLDPHRHQSRLKP